MEIEGTTPEASASVEMTPEARADFMQAQREDRPYEPTAQQQAAVEPPQPQQEAKPPEPEKPKGDLNVALRQEREERRRLERQLAELTGEVRASRQPVQQQPQQQAQLPDPYADPSGYMLAREPQLLQAIHGLERQVQGMTQAQQHAAMRDAVLQDYASDAQRFAAANPDWSDAYKHFINTRHAELEGWGVTDPKQRNELIVQDELKMAFAARQRGLSPAEVLFAASKARGFAAKPPQPTQADQVATAVNANAQAIQNLAKAQAANRSLSTAEGTPGGEVTLEMLTRMSAEERAEFRAKNPKKHRMLLGAPN